MLLKYHFLTSYPSWSLSTLVLFCLEQLLYCFLRSWDSVTLGTRSHLALGHTWYSVTLGTQSHLALSHTWLLVPLGTRSHLVLGHTWHLVTLGTWSHLALSHTWHSVTLGTRSLGALLSWHLVHLTLGSSKYKLGLSWGSTRLRQLARS